MSKTFIDNSVNPTVTYINYLSMDDNGNVCIRSIDPSISKTYNLTLNNNGSLKLIGSSISVEWENNKFLALSIEENEPSILYNIESAVHTLKIPEASGILATKEWVQETFGVALTEIDSLIGDSN